MAVNLSDQRCLLHGICAKKEALRLPSTPFSLPQKKGRLPPGFVVDVATIRSVHVSF
jgi:hypothetical protein